MGSLSNGDEIYAVMRDELRPEVLKTVENSTRASMNIVNDISNSLNEISEGDFSIGTITPFSFIIY